MSLHLRLRFLSFVLFLLITASSSAVLAQDAGGLLWDGTAYMDSKYSTGAHLLHNIGITGYGVSAAVLDTPFDVRHEILKNNIIAEASAGFSADSPANGYYKYSGTMTNIADDGVYWGTGLTAVSVPGQTPESEKEYGSGTDFATRFRGIAHGTHVAGTVLGMAPDAGLVLLTAASWTEGDPAQRSSATIQSFLASDYALSYVADIAKQYNIVAMNNSWGGPYFDYDSVDPDTQQILYDLRDNGVATVFATGNDGESLISYPAHYDATIPVGALGQDGLLAPFSDHNKEDAPSRIGILLAPGVNVYSSYPYNNDYGPNTGTSMAAPHVTGAITLLASGARNADSAEIYEALWNSANVSMYDGNAVKPRDFLFSDDLFTLLGRVAAADPGISWTITDPGNGAIDRTQDEWRELSRLEYVWRNLAAPYADEKNMPVVDAMVHFLKNNEENNTRYPYFGSLNNVELRFIQVDKAYRYLTNSRMNKRSLEIANPGAGMLRGFAGELAADINQETADIFQRLDALDSVRLAEVSRAFSPQLSVETVEYAQMGVLSVHRSIGRSGDVARYFPQVQTDPADECAPAPLAVVDHRQKRFWAEGFGSFGHRSGDIDRAGFDSRFVGGTLGFEGRHCDLRYGVFGSYADLKVDSDDGRSDGKWYTGGLYGRLDRRRYFVQASASYSYGDFKPNRDVFIPGTVFLGYAPVVLDPMRFAANAKTKAHSASAWLGFGFDLWEGRSWSVGPRVEGAYSFAHMRGYTERGGGSLNLRVDGMNNHYAEGGVGMAVAKSIENACGERKFTFTAKVLGVYGSSFGDRMRGAYTQYGASFEASAKRTKGFSVVPEASATWNIRENVDLTASYAGRFGKRRSENSGSLKIGFSF